jgi:hypothetical protein
MTTSALTVPSSPTAVCPILTGSAIPAAILRTSDEEVFDLNSAVSRQPSVLVFYRGGW